MFSLSNSVSVKFLGNKLAPHSSQNNLIISPRWLPQLSQNILDSYAVLFCFHTVEDRSNLKKAYDFSLMFLWFLKFCLTSKSRFCLFFESEILFYYESDILLLFFFRNWNSILFWNWDSFYFESEILLLFFQKWDSTLFRNWDSSFFSKVRFYFISKLRFSLIRNFVSEFCFFLIWDWPSRATINRNFDSLNLGFCFILQFRFWFIFKSRLALLGHPIDSYQGFSQTFNKYLNHKCQIVLGNIHMLKVFGGL